MPYHLATPQRRVNATTVAGCANTATIGTMRKFSIVTILAALSLSACTGERGSSMHSLISNVDYDVSFYMEPATPVVGEETHITFSVSRKGTAVDVLNAENQVMHITVTSDNLRDYGHYAFGDIREIEPGTYQFTHTFTESDHYGIWIDFPNLTTRDHHGDRLDFRSFSEITIQGGEAAPLPEAVSKVTQEPFTISLRTKEDLMAELINVFTFELSRTDGVETKYFEDADMFYVIVAPAMGEYRLQHIDHHISTKNSVGTEISAFEKPGKYLIWAELYVHGDTGIDTVRTTFIVDVPPYVSPSLQ